MYFVRHEIIKLSEIFETSPIFHEEGLKVYELAIELFNKDKRSKYNTLLSIDFSGIDHTSFAFLNASIGKLNIEGFDNIKCFNITSFFNEKIKAVIENANKERPCMLCGRKGGINA